MSEESLGAELLPEARGWDRLRRPVWLFDDEAKRHVYANDAALALWGAPSREEFLARDCSNQSEAVRARTRRLIHETSDGASLSERWTFYPNGQPMPVDVVASTFHAPDGRPLLMLEGMVATQDADAARSLEALRHTPAMIGLVDRDCNPIFRNPAAFEAFGLKPVNYDERYVNSAAAKAMYEMAWAGMPSSAMLLAQTHQGERWILTEALRINDPATGMECLLLNGQDVSAQIDAENALAAAAERAQLAETRERMLTEFSHEMRTPLNSVSGFVELLLAKDLEDDVQKDLLCIQSAAKELSVLIDGMLAESTPEATEDHAPEATDPVPYGGPPRQLRILYADDNENNRRLVATMAAALGWLCDTANDGSEAVQRLKQGGYDLVLMDIQMPVMDGIEATQAIRSLPGPVGRIPIVALTANTLVAQRQHYAAVGMQDCIAKPFAIAELAAKVNAWSVDDWRDASNALSNRRQA